MHVIRVHFNVRWKATRGPPVMSLGLRDVNGCTFPPLLWHVKASKPEKGKAALIDAVGKEKKDARCINRSIAQPHLISERFVFPSLIIGREQSVPHTPVDLMVHHLRVLWTHCRFLFFFLKVLMLKGACRVKLAKLIDYGIFVNLLT